MGTFIKIVFQHRIDVSCRGDFEKRVFEITYREFLLKCQAYNQNGKLKTFADLKAADGRANSLHYKLVFPIGNLMLALQGKIPGLSYMTGDALPFSSHKLDLLSSSVEDKNQHALRLHFFTPEMELLDHFGHFLLLRSVDGDAGEAVHLLEIQAGMSICAYRKAAEASPHTWQVRESL